MRVLITGAYGCQNLGDETILAVIIRGLLAERPDTTFSVVSFDPQDTRRRHPGVHVVGAGDLNAGAAAVADADLILLGGGGVFYDYQGIAPHVLFTGTTPWAIALYALPLIAILAGKPVMLYAQGVGPLLHPVGERLVGMICRELAAGTVRDPASRDLLIRLGVAPDRLAVTADPAFLAGCSPRERIEEVLREQGLPARDFMVVCPRPWAGGDWRAVLARVVRTRFDTSALVIFPMVRSSEGDLALASELAGQVPAGTRVHVISREYSAPDVIGIFSRARVVVSMRLHGLVFGALARVPLIALAYDPKVTALMQRLGLARFSLELPDAAAAKFEPMLTDVMTDAQAVRRELEARVPELIELARSDARRAVGLIPNATRGKAVL